MTHTYKTNGTCSRFIHFELKDGIVRGVRFDGGCNGNLQGIGKLVEGKPAAEVAQTLAGIRCGFKPTSCPDQLSRALTEALAEEEAAQ